MTRQSRILAVLAAVGLVGVTALVLMARQYEKMIRGASAARASAGTGSGVARVSAFVEVRRAMRASLDQISGGEREATLRELRSTRDAALARAGMAPAEYLALGRAYRSWQEGGGRESELALAFEQRRADLRRADLGEYERSDF